MAIDRPNVTSSGGRMSGPSTRFSTTRCKSQPRTNIRGAAISTASQGDRPSPVTSTRMR